MNNKTSYGIVFFCALLSIVLFVQSGRQKEKKAYEWAEQHGYSILEIEEQKHYGPYSHKEKDQKIFRARVKDKNNQDRWIWFRIGWFTDVKEE
jgi:hypothetical protein